MSLLSIVYVVQKKSKEEEALEKATAMKNRPKSASAYSTGKSEAVKARLHSTSTSIDGTPRNRGPTTPRPFNLTSSAKKENLMSTEEMQVALAKAKMQ
eukprot:scaffold91134_cov47-Prasinocladus_malaysianus.AAC.2